ncbi:MAG TPA: maleylacetoacetate isomerase [Caulobacteraceae bacterium]|nr:maleylacetoacetate isomerase [Caulobacteraceae bacterium]
MSEVLLFDYWRSSAAYRVRIGLNLKGVRYDSRAINILPGRDEQLAADYLALNRQGRVPMIRTPRGTLVQSMAILEWLDETRPDPGFLPVDPWDRAQVRAFAATVACDIHPLNNLATQRQIHAQWGDDPAGLKTWGEHWVGRGCEVLEGQLAGLPSHRFAFGDQPSLADICLVPQLYNARRMGLDLSPYPRLVGVDAAARAHPAFAAAAPELQPDAPETVSRAGL